MATSVVVHLISVQHGQRFPRQCQDARTLRGRKKESAVRRSRGGQGKGPFVWDTWVFFFGGTPLCGFRRKPKGTPFRHFAGTTCAMLAAKVSFDQNPGNALQSSVHGGGYALFDTRN